MCPKKIRQVSVPQEIPESRLRNDFIRREDAHTVDFRVGLIGGRQVTSDNLVLLKAHLRTGSVLHPDRKSEIHQEKQFSKLISSREVSGCMIALQMKCSL
jgi:hypothetical protein